MKIAVFSTKVYDREFLKSDKHEFVFFKEELSEEMAQRTQGFEGVCIFVNDQANANVLKKLKENGIKVILLRCAGYNNVDLKEAKNLGIKVYSVPRYSPAAVAEFAVGLMLTLNRHIHKAYNRVRDNNFALDGLMGFDMEGKTVGVVGTGGIGAIVVRIMAAFGCKILAYDVYKNEKLQKEQPDMKYVELDEIWKQCHVISLHAPLTKETEHMINDDAVSKMKDGVLIVNTSRGPLVDTKAIIKGLKSKKIGAVGLDVYENESSLFYSDHSKDIPQDDLLSRLISFPNVIVTGHQAFFTKEALTNIAKSTNDNIDNFLAGKDDGELTKNNKSNL